MRIAMLEDDSAQGTVMENWLTAATHAVRWFKGGKAMVKDANRESYDVFLLDWEVPDMSGPEVLAWVREHVEHRVPVMFITARNEEADIVAALDAGADDYITKPLRRSELLSRIEALARRAVSLPGADDLLPYAIDADRERLLRDGKPIELTQKEYQLALMLFRNVGKLLSRGHLLDSVWGQNSEVTMRTIDTHVSRLRTKLGLTPEHGWKLSSVYLYGYRLERVNTE